MNIDKNKKSRSQAKRRFTRVFNNLKKSIDDSIISKTLENRSNEFKEAWAEVHHNCDRY